MADTPDRVREVMESVKNLHVLATVDEDGKPRMRWMGALVEDPDEPWTFYLACGAESRKMAQIGQNPNAQLLFSQTDEWNVATLSGTAEASQDAEIRQMMWDSISAIHKYYEGPDDPKMGVIKFKTQSMELLARHERREPYHLDL